MPTVEILSMNHDKDHIHILVSIPPKFRVSDVVRYIKSQSGRLMKRRYLYMRKAYYGRDGIWSDGYFVSTVGVNEQVIKKYIERQGQEDNGQTQFDLWPAIKSRVGRFSAVIPRGLPRGASLSFKNRAIPFWRRPNQSLFEK